MRQYAASAATVTFTNTYCKISTYIQLSTMNYVEIKYLQYISQSQDV